MVWGGEFSGSQQTRITQEDFVIGCLVDLDTGLMTFTANGNEVNTFYQVSKCQYNTGVSIIPCFGILAFPIETFQYLAHFEDF